MAARDPALTERHEPERLPPARPRRKNPGVVRSGTPPGEPGGRQEQSGSDGGLLFLPALRRSADRVLRERRDLWSRHALGEDEAASLVRGLLTWVESGALPADLIGSAGQKALMQRLIDLLREDLLGPQTALSDRDLVEAIRCLDRLRSELDPDWRESLASQLMGAHAPDLVVEIAHDLRSPLTSVMFLAETLRKGQSGEINDVQRKQLGIIYSAAFGLASMANDLMDSARVTEKHDHGADPEAFSISELVESVRVMVVPMVEEKKLELLSRARAHDVRMGFPVPLGRVLLNLVTNAIKFTESGAVEIVVEETRGSRVQFSVLDTGRGMDAAALSDLYQPFRRSRSETGFHFSNTGLGLSICARLVERMGGELQVEPRPEGGTRFFFELKVPRASRI